MGKEGKGNFQLKTPKGTRDWQGTDVVLRDQIFSKITEVFKRHGGVTIDTPVFELKDVLSGKYGEDSKLIYDLADQGGEICSLRYDLTVPFARFLAQTATQQIKRYAFAKVYRRDQPAMTKGRMREFYQCDFDIAGTYDLMLPDAEILRVIKEVFDDLPGNWKGKYTIKINHRKILDGIFQICGVPEDKIRTISSAVDKLDKSPWEEVRREMTEDKGLDPAVADKIGEYVSYKGGREVVGKLQALPDVQANESATQGLKEMALLCDYLEIYDVLPALSIDMSLARGLDYYTGVIYEVVTEGSAPSAPTKDSSKKEKKQKKSADPDEDRSNDPTIGVGSVAAGGRYDTLVGMFSGKPIPCVGISFGVDRIFSITKTRLGADSGGIRPNEVDAYVMAFGGGKDFTGMLRERMQVAKELWDAGIKAEYLWKQKPKLQNQFKAAENGKVPWAVILGEDELKAGKVKIKEMGLPEDHAEKNGVEVEKANLVQELKARMEGRRIEVVDRTV